MCSATEEKAELTMNGAVWLPSRQGKPAEGMEVRKGLNETEWGEGFLEGAGVFLKLIWKGYMIHNL